MGKYEINVRCLNCECSSRVTIEQGYEVRQGCCPVCGCATLKPEYYPDVKVVEDKE